MLASARKEVMQSKKAVEVCQQEFASLKAECASLQGQIAEKHKKNVELEAFKKKLFTEIETYKKTEVSFVCVCFLCEINRNFSERFT